MLEGEKEVLKEEAAAATARLKEHRETLAASTRELGQLQHLAPRLEDLQQQVPTIQAFVLSF